MITEDYCSYEVAKLLKEKGFYTPYCYSYYFPEIKSKTPCITNRVIHTDEDKYLAPTFQMAMKWLREVHKLPINIWYDKEEDTPDDEVWTSEIAVGNPYILVGSFASYEEAVEAALKYCLENKFDLNREL